MDIDVSSNGVQEVNESEKGMTFVPVELDVSVSDETFVKGVRGGDGDGTVPLVSLGLMCVHPELWKGSEGKTSTAYNPSGLPVRTREYRHEPLKDFDLFAALSSAGGGGTSADHVDILGNSNFKEILY